MNWLLLAYRVPRDPTANRVYVWRKLKQLGAISLQDAVWMLPASERNREQFQWLASEITELGGEASLFGAESLMSGVDATLREQFEEPVHAAYEKILAALKRKNPDLAALAKMYQQTNAQDFFHCPLADKVRVMLLSGRDDTP